MNFLRRPLFALGFVSALIFQSHATEPNAVIKLWPGPPPGDAVKTTGPEQDITKPTDKLIAGRRIIKLANVATPEMHVFLPPKEKRNGTAIVICPGGGFNILAWDLEGTEVAEWLNSIGVTGIVLKYRVPTGSQNPKWLQPVQDAQRALSLARSKASEWGVNTGRIGVLGFSAGGATAGYATLKNGERLYEAADDADKLSCRPDFGVLAYPAYFVDSKTQQLLPELKVTKQTPPMFFAHAFDDGIRPENSVQLFLALKQAGVPSELHVYDAGGHGFGMRPVENAPNTHWAKRCKEWMSRNGWLKAAARP